MRINTNPKPIINSVVNITLLYLANQFGRKISKLSFLESECFLAKIVKGQYILKISNTMPSPITSPIQIQVRTFMVLVIPE
ncbi:MAG: hypothetical protein ACI8VZ_001494 [Candidatus Paceibacteria bacterium]|jgi:hypothetical protein